MNNRTCRLVSSQPRRMRPGCGQSVQSGSSSPDMNTKSCLKTGVCLESASKAAHKAETTQLVSNRSKRSKYWRPNFAIDTLYKAVPTDWLRYSGKGNPVSIFRHKPKAAIKQGPSWRTFKKPVNGRQAAGLQQGCSKVAAGAGKLDKPPTIP